MCWTAWGEFLQNFPPTEPVGGDKDVLAPFPIQSRCSYNLEDLNDGFTSLQNTMSKIPRRKIDVVRGKNPYRCGLPKAGHVTLDGNDADGLPDHWMRRDGIAGTVRSLQVIHVSLELGVVGCLALKKKAPTIRILI
jgi:hypothetical protein